MKIIQFNMRTIANSHRRLGQLLLCLFMIVLTVACGSLTRTASLDRSAGEACRMVQHTAGETCVPLVPQRIVALWTATVANLLALDIRPIGITSYPEASGIQLPSYLKEKLPDTEYVGDQNQPSLEKILKLQPDLILGAINQSVYAQLSQIAPTLLLKWEGTPSWKQHLFDVAASLGKIDQAEQVMERYNQRVAALKAALSGSKNNSFGKPYQELQISFVHLCCNEIDLDLKNSFIGSILEDIGLQRPPAQAKIVEGGMIKISDERLADADGDIIFVTTFSDEDDRILKRLKQNPLWSQLKAVQRNQVYQVDYSTWRGADVLAANRVIDELFQYLVNP